MRALTLAALFVLALPAAAQPVAPPTTPSGPTLDAGLFGELGVSPGYSSRLGVLHETRAVVGYRLPSGVTMALAASVDGGDAFSTLAVGPEIGLTRSLGSGTTVALRADGRASFVRGDHLAGAGYQPASLSAYAEGVVTRQIGLGRGLDLALTGGLYGAFGRRLDVGYAPGTVVGNRVGGPYAEAGAVVGVQLEFDALGGRFSIGPAGNVPLTATESARGGGLTDGRRAGLVRFRF